MIHPGQQTLFAHQLAGQWCEATKCVPVAGCKIPIKTNPDPDPPPRVEIAGLSERIARALRGYYGRPYQGT